MRLIEVLPDYEVKRFSRSPTLTNDDRKKYFKIDDSIRGVIEKTKQPYNQIGLLVQYGYFKVSGKFFTTKSFKLTDIKAAGKNLGVTPSDNFIEKYTDRTRQRHRLLILDTCGHIDFGSATAAFEEAVSDMVDKQMHPRKLFYVLVEQLRQKKIELPSYDHIAKTITDKFHIFEKTVVQNITDIITPEQQEALNQLIITGNESYERALLTRLKLITQSMKPAKIGKDKYIPILQMMAEINELTTFTSSFKHHKITGSKATPENEIFYAGIFGLGSSIGLHKLANTAIGINVHSTDTHGYTEMVFAVSHLIGVTFAPRIKDLSSQNLVSFAKIKAELEHKGYPITPTYYVNENKIRRNWDNILRLIATIKLREHRASTIIKRFGDYSSQHPSQEALKEFGRIIKSIFILKYVDDVEWRQAIEKQLNKGELANKFSAAVSFADQNILEALKEDQEIAVMCKTIIQNIIILWNYIELTKIIMRSDTDEREHLLENITNASIPTWQHVNLHGTYDFSNLLSSNDSDYTLDDVINFKAS